MSLKSVRTNEDHGARMGEEGEFGLPPTDDTKKSETLETSSDRGNSSSGRGPLLSRFRPSCGAALKGDGARALFPVRRPLRSL